MREPLLFYTYSHNTHNMKKLFISFKEWIAGLFSDEKGTASSKRFVGIICALTLCVTLYHNSFSTADVAPADGLIDSVALLAFGCLGLTSIDKFIAAKGKTNETTN
jgi:hypothetical protein